MLAFAYNTAVHATTKCTPFELVFGRKPKIPLDLVFGDIQLDLNLTPETYVSKLEKNLKKAFKNVEHNRDKAAVRNKIRVDRKVRACPDFKPGELLYLLETTTNT